jgi:outer membrane receptor protein involved in Fe transport
MQRIRWENVPRYDKYENENYHRWLYEPQHRDLLYLSYRHSRLLSLMNSAQLNLSFQKQREGRIIQKDPSGILTRELDGVETLGLTAQFDAVIPGQLITYGFDYYRDLVNSRRKLEDPVSGSISEEARGRYPDDARYAQLGVYIQNEIQISEKWLLNPGLRFSHHSTQFDLPEDTLAGPLRNRVDLEFTSLTGSAGIVYRLNEAVNLSFLYSQGFRAPNLSDLSKLGESKSAVYEIPNPGLQPERAQNVETGIKFKNEHGEASLAVYYSDLNDLLASADDRYQGSDFIEINGRLFKVKSKQNIGSGYITGLEHAFHYRISAPFIIRGHLTYTYGQNKSANEPIGGIPPLYGLLGIRYKHARFNLDSYIRFAGQQDRLSDDDLDDLRIPEGGTPGWYTLNLRAHLPLTPHFRLHLGIENILDRNYREHGSGINAPGRNFIISVRFSR